MFRDIFQFSLFFKKDLAFAELGHLIKTLSCATFSKRLNAATNLENEFKMVPRKILCLDIFVQVFIFCLHFGQLFVYFWFDGIFSSMLVNSKWLSVLSTRPVWKMQEYGIRCWCWCSRRYDCSCKYFRFHEKKNEFLFIYFFRVNWEEKKSLVLISERYGDSIPEEAYGED